ncbi:hypothetical protein DL764_005995 [Monosporascus ibericus]|uniref:Uncharacterized protein n=1 Tax=Monosporascus ibericus TaxID=155417 RepID=A0A4Q4T9I1_9PEZI|nr:hypothetical protein DL764_005995 [Monosporascus ibericus]
MTHNFIACALRKTAENTDHIQTIGLGPLDHIAPSTIPQSTIYLSLKQGASPQDAFSALREEVYILLSFTYYG